MNKLFVVGLGPGEYGQMTGKAVEALTASDVIIGYTVYVSLVEDHFPGKRFLTTPMTKEKERCIMAFEEAKKGQTVSMICSGDSGIYGMSGLMLQLLEQFPDVQLELIPGITAASSGSAVLGAPLMHDFAVISLSDLLTPWEKIEQRLDAAAKADFSICLYNPSSKKRGDYLAKACTIVAKYRLEDTVCGIVKNIGREGEEKKIMTLKELTSYQADMFTTVFIGNSQTKQLGAYMVTPRGYQGV